METKLKVQLDNSDDDSTADYIKTKTDEDLEDKLIYTVEDTPPFVFSVFQAFQIVICQVWSIVWMTSLLAPSLCMLQHDAIRVSLTSAALLASGLSTVLQSALGLRLPVVAAPSVLYTSGLLAVLGSEGPPCPSPGDLYAMGSALRMQEWQIRLRTVQGALLFAACLQTVLGFSRLQAQLSRVFTPVVVGPTIILYGLGSLQRNSTLWTESSVSQTAFSSSIVVMLFILFSMIMRNVHFPLPSFSLSQGLLFKGFPLFQMFPVLWTLVAAYVIITVVPLGSETTHSEQEVYYQEAVKSSQWYYFPYPFAWGWPVLSTHTALLMVPTVLLQSLASHFLFYAHAHVCNAQAPPAPAVSRGLTVEGLGLILGSFWGHTVSSSHMNISMTFFTKIGSRHTTLLAGLLMVCLSFFTSAVSILANIPTQILGPVNLCLQAGVVCVGISMLKAVRLSSPRDCTVVSLALSAGLMIPRWLTSPGVSLHSGFSTLDSLLAQTLSTPVIIGAVISCTLDLIIPGKSKYSPFSGLKHNSRKEPDLYRLPSWQELFCRMLDCFPCFSMK